MPFTDAPGFRMHYETGGSGFPLLLVNGLGSDTLEWVDQLPAFSRSYRVVAFDNRGAGESDAPPGPYTTAAMADDAAALLAFLGIARAHVLGVSLGGMIAQEIALRHPGLVERLVLACTSPGGDASDRPEPSAVAAFVREPGTDPRADLLRSVPFLYSERYRREQPARIEEFIRRRLSAPVSAPGHAGQLAAAIGHAVGGRARAIRAKTLVIAGTGDLLVPPSNSRRLAEMIPGAALVLLAGAPHRLFAENAEAFNREVLEFLGRP